MINYKELKLLMPLAVLAGFMGGVVAAFFIADRHVFAGNPDQEYFDAKTIHGKLVRGEQFLLVDKKGAARGVWLLDSSGNPRISLMGKDGSIAELVITPEGSAALRLFDKRGNSTATIVAGNGAPQMTLFKSKVAQVRLGLPGDGLAHLYLMDEDGKSIWSSPIK